MSAAFLALAAALIAATPPEAGTATTSLSSAQSSTTTPAFVESDSGANPWIITGSSLAILGVLGAWGYGAWWDEPTEAFHFKDTGFLNRDTYAGGSDKLGHAYVCYLATVGVTRLYEKLGMDHLTAALVSSGVVMLVGNGVELADGITPYGFEYGDVIANSLGIGLGLAGELSPFVKNTFGARLGYVPSRDFLANDKTFIKFINDYTGMLFYLDIKPKGIIEELGHDPGLWRYVIGGLVWGTDQYSPVRTDSERRRSFGVHLGLSLSEVLRAAYPDDDGVALYADFFDYYAVPFLSVSVMTDLNTGDWLLNFGVSNRSELNF